MAYPVHRPRWPARRQRARRRRRQRVAAGPVMTAWLAVIGIGEDGWSGLSEAAKALVASAELIVGGTRHLALVPPGASERLAWKSPLADTMPVIAARRGRRV